MEEPLPSNEYRKLDTGMAAAYRTWQANKELAPDAAIAVTLRHTGELARIEDLGFQTDAVIGDQVFGQVRFRDVPELVGEDAVLWLAAGTPSKKHLDTAVRDIRARASAPVSGAAVDGLWHADVASGALTHVPKATGKGVIVAVIDTGIDFTHPMFIDKATGKTRIQRIWDQTLTAATVAECPPIELLVSSDTYGVEFDAAKIQVHLAGGAEIAHRDCDGHGTHVAGIAAGGTNFTSILGSATLVGVAPEADIIAVKIPLGEPHLKVLYKQLGSEVLWDRLFADAVLYCLRTARKLSKPVVINMSIGNYSYPGDGLDDGARLIDEVLNPATPASGLNFPTGALVVKAAGNDGEASSRMARITVPASGQIVVPFALVDDHGTEGTVWNHCRRWRYKPTLSAFFWYARPSAPLAVSFAVRSPHQANFSADVSAGATLELGVNAQVGPPAKDTWAAWADDVHRVKIEHKDVPPVAHPAGGLVRRQYVAVTVGPKSRGGAVTFHQGIYEVRITAPAGTVAYVYSELKLWGEMGSVLRLNEKNQDGTAAHVNIGFQNNGSIFDSGGRHVITVANFTDQADPDDSLVAGAAARRSSRGPLRDFSVPPLGPIATKPDIAAPGNKILSSTSRHTEGLILWPWWYWGVRFEEKGGTSMAAPMVAGVLALMLEKQPTLNATQARAALFSGPRPPIEPNTAPASTEAYGVGRVDAMTSHANTP
jgi:subtilisin family serine protease